MAKKYKITDDFLSFVTTHSSYIKKLVQNYGYIIDEINESGWDKTFEQIILRVSRFDSKKCTKIDLMSALRIAKNEASLLIGLADISEEWDLQRTTNTLSEFADLAITKSVEFLIQDRTKNKYFRSSDIDKSGYIVIAAGKLGGYELNYSSDIDLIVLYNQENPNYIGSQNIKQFYINITQELVEIIQKLTADGYVFRVDLRLRPDPFSTPIALTTRSAEIYYENVGQNWERAAMIKARFVAGDNNLGEKYMKFMSRFVWRKYLDFGAINDIHSIKRQIESKADFSPDTLLGYNIKLGKGGIREIEFFAQVQQLVWGGRQEELRSKETCKTLRTLESLGKIKKGKAEELIAAYGFYRDIEHRLQMRADEATHDLPSTEEDLEKFASFMGFETLEEFTSTLHKNLALAQKYYAELFIDSPSLGAEGNLVFTGVSDDPETLVTLAKMGFSNPSKVCEIMRGWHHGRRRATRLKNVREILTEITPLLLETIANSSNPDVAFNKFDHFLNELPSGVQIFSLFNEKPKLTKLFVEIMGNSPWLAENFSRSPSLVSKILSSNFKTPLSPVSKLSKLLEQNLKAAEGDEDAFAKIIRRWKHDMEFQVGIRLLKNYISHAEASIYLSEIAEMIVNKTLESVRDEVEGQIVIIAMGRLGDKQLTFDSDLDLVAVYEPKEGEQERLYLKLIQKFTKIITSMSEDGVLYTVDKRLRPSGNQGALASRLNSYKQYYQGGAWSWEFMALTKARAIAGDQKLCKEVSKTINELLTRERDKKKLAEEMFDMRKKVATQFYSKNMWDIKYADGGLFEIEFIVQYYKLTEAHEHKELTSKSLQFFWEALEKKKIISPNEAKQMQEAERFLQDLQSQIRLISQTGFSPEKASKNQKRLLVENFPEKTFSELEKRLQDTQKLVNNNFNKTFQET